LLAPSAGCAEEKLVSGRAELPLSRRFLSVTFLRSACASLITREARSPGRTPVGRGAAIAQGDLHPGPRNGLYGPRSPAGERTHTRRKLLATRFVGKSTRKPTRTCLRVPARPVKLTRDRAVGLGCGSFSSTHDRLDAARRAWHARGSPVGGAPPRQLKPFHPCFFATSKRFFQSLQQ